MHDIVFFPSPQTKKRRYAKLVSAPRHTGRPLIGGRYFGQPIRVLPIAYPPIRGVLKQVQHDKEGVKTNKHQNYDK